MSSPVELNFTFAVSARAKCSACKFKLSKEDGTEMAKMPIGAPRIGLTKWGQAGEHHHLRHLIEAKAS